MLMWATKVENPNLGGYVTEWDSELRHAAVSGRGGQISKMRLLPPALSARVRATTCHRGQLCTVLGMRELPVTVPGAPYIVSVRRNRRWLGRAASGWLGLVGWSPNKGASDRHVPPHW